MNELLLTSVLGVEVGALVLSSALTAYYVSTRPRLGLDTVLAIIMFLTLLFNLYGTITLYESIDLIENECNIMEDNQYEPLGNEPEISELIRA